MSQTDPAPTGPHEDAAFAAAEATLSQARTALERSIERITPWLVDLGSWIFAGLIATLLVVLAALITVGPVDRAITLAAVMCALAFPLDLAGLILLKLLQDLTRMGLPNEWARTFRDAGFPVRAQMATSPQALTAQWRRRSNIVLLYCLGMLTLSVGLTLVGLVAALWHLAWWIGVVFCVMAIISLGLVIAAFVTVRPSDSPEQRELNRRYWEAMLRRADEQATSSHERG